MARRRARRFVVIVDEECNVVAREESDDPFFAEFFGEDGLPKDVEALARANERTNSTRFVSDRCLMHTVPIVGPSLSLTALIFEELRLRESA
ncbi:MAG TPA: hypothetical protein VFA29_10545 [Candidatus Baltobacteraceae bacterium]|nr:hypothetical protein [Candidatus Baltobacteraceae bacterium]